ncbi:MAG: hypothetical protein FJ035_09780 [Chloroflexi bacterium]|nr:hypothetical protein [Chloroflexota bacterium]
MLDEQPQAEGGRAPLGVLLTGGRGTRLQPLTPALPKALVPLLERPLVAHGVALLAELGLREIVVVVASDDAQTGPAAQRYAPPGVTVHIAVQAEPRGSGDALASVGAALADRAVVVLAVDTVLRGHDLARQLRAFERSGAVAWLPLHETDRPHEMGIAELGDGGRSERIVTLEEKPPAPRSNLACVGVWILAPSALTRVQRDPVINPRGEADLTATVAALLDEGHVVGGAQLTGRWLDTGSLGALLATQAALLAELAPGAPFAAPRCALSGVVHARDGARVTASTLAGPLLIADAARVEGCVLGPDVVVGEGAALSGVTLRDALVAPGARLAGGVYASVVVTADGTVTSAR